MSKKCKRFLLEKFMPSRHGISRRSFVAGATALAGSALLPKSTAAFESQDPVINSQHPSPQITSRERVQWAAVPFPMKQVRLLPGQYETLAGVNRKYLNSLPTDRLAHTFRLTSNITSTA